MSNVNIFFTIFCLEQNTEIGALCASVCVYAVAELNQDNKERQF